MTLTMDILDGGMSPRRGDQLHSKKHTYHVLASRKVKRKNHVTNPRFSLMVVRDDRIHEEASEGLVERLKKSALRRDGIVHFTFTFYKRQPKKRGVHRSFEAYMRSSATIENPAVRS